MYASPLRNDAAYRAWSSICRINLFSVDRLQSAQIPRRTWVQNALNLNLEPANGSGLDTSGAVALAAAVSVKTVLEDMLTY
jgi:hypothetical protein